MKKCHLVKCVIASVLMSMCFFPFATAAETDTDHLDHRNVKTIIESHLSQNPLILDASKDKDIVIFLGNTGAGKSTVINYLSDKIALKANKLGDIVLENPEDTTAMAIGEGSHSKTFLPAFIEVGDELFFDLPGFKDTRGTARSLVNACFIKHVIENARRVKLIFVAGIDQITTDRGSSFKNLLNNAKQLIPNKIIENFSALVITKSHITRDNLMSFLDAKLPSSLENDFYILRDWIKQNHIEQMNRPTQNTMEAEDRRHILKLIKNIKSEQVENVNIDAIFDLSEQHKIIQLYDKEIADIIDHLMQNIPSSSADINSLERKKNYMLNDFRRAFNKKLAESAFINLLRSISQNLYQPSLNQKNQSLTLVLERLVNEINVEIKEIEKQAEKNRRIEAENALREAERKRIQAEAFLKQAQESARVAAEELRARKEADENQRRAQEAQASVATFTAPPQHDIFAQQKEMAWNNYNNAVNLYRKYFNGGYSPHTGIYTHEGLASLPRATKILQMLAYGPGLPTKIAPQNLGLTRKDFFENYQLWSQWRNSDYNPYTF